MNVRFLTILSFLTLAAQTSEARIARPLKPKTPQTNESIVQVKASSKTNCKFNTRRGFSANGCTVTRVSNGDILGQAGCGNHKGCDYPRANKSQPTSPILAVKAGTVVFAGWSGSGYGNRVVIDHGGGVFTTYSHLANFQVKKGSRVSEGSPLGKMGSTGATRAIHLHFELVKGGKFVNSRSDGGYSYDKFCR